MRALVRQERAGIAEVETVIARLRDADIDRLGVRRAPTVELPDREATLGRVRQGRRKREHQQHGDEQKGRFHGRPPTDRRNIAQGMHKVVKRCVMPAPVIYFGRRGRLAMLIRLICLFLAIPVVALAEVMETAAGPSRRRAWRGTSWSTGITS